METPRGRPGRGINQEEYGRNGDGCQGEEVNEVEEVEEVKDEGASWRGLVAMQAGRVAMLGLEEGGLNAETQSARRWRREEGLPGKPG